MQARQAGQTRQGKRGRAGKAGSQGRQAGQAGQAAVHARTACPTPARLPADGRTALMLACVKGFRETVQLLLEAGADVNAKDAFGGTAM